jgi:two-component system phosphate regulon sensor histidine kinase PhoR
MPEREALLLALDPSPALDLMERALRAANYDVMGVREKAALEAALAESSPALLLIGDTFNGSSGIDIAAVQRERFPTLPILVFVQNDSPEVFKGALRAGLNGVVSAPLTTDEILRTVERALKRASYLGDWLRREVRRTTDTLERRTRYSESEKGRLESIIGGIEDGVIVVDPEKKLILINRAARRIFGLHTLDLTGESLGRVISHPDLQALLEPSGDGDPRTCEMNFDDGRVFKAQRATIQQIGSAITLHDVTDLKRLEMIKGDFVHAVSHDLRSPLTAVLGYAELVERVGPLNEHQLDFVKRIQESVKSITALVNELLNYGRIESGLDAHREKLQLEGVLQASLGLFDSLITRKKLQMKLAVASGLPPLRANPIRMRQVLDNLIGNAIKYTPETGEIRLGIREWEHQLVLEVTDSGPGIPLKDQAHVFEKYYRAHNVDGTEGSGLGLSIVKSIVDSYNGRVWVESAEGKGASFFVVLPTVESKED